MKTTSCKNLIILMALFSVASSELLKPPQPPQHNYAFHKFRPPPPPPEPTFIQRITSWIFPWGGVSSEEEYRMPASPKIDAPQIVNPPRQFLPVARVNPVQVRDTEPTTARTTQAPPVSKCSPCNKVPWIPMIPTYQLPVVNSRPDQQQVYFKHHFGNENQYAQVPNGYKYEPPSSTATSTVPIKIQNGDFNSNGHKYYGIPPIKNVQSFEQSTKAFEYTRATTFKPNTNTIDTSVITFTTNRSQNKRPLRYTASASSVTNPEYLLPPNILPLENEKMAPIPIPNLSPTPIPPLFDSKNFLHDPYRSQKVGFIKLVPLEPVAQVSNNINVQVKPDINLREFAAIEKSPAVEVINSNLVAEFTIPGELEKTQPTISYQRTTEIPFRNIKLDVGNSIDTNRSIVSPIIVENFETATDNVGEGTEDDFRHDIDQKLDGEIFKQSLDESIDVEESNRLVRLPNAVDTTTEGKYTVKFEPSIQTAADLAEKENSTKKNKPNDSWRNRDRLTPLEMLDSPIFHVTPFTNKPKSIETTEKPPPPFKPIEDFTKKLATLWTSPTPIISSTQAATTTVRTTKLPTSTTPILKTTLSYLSTLSGIKPPKEPTPVKLQSSTKKPKQIQIVIPYTTYHKPSPFKVQEEQEILTYRPLIRGHYVTHPTRTALPAKNLELETVKKVETTKKPEQNDLYNGHGYHNDQEYPDHAQESKIVESKVTAEPPRTTKYLTKILANNIRDLLKKEKTPKPPKIDLIRLQKNIDGWTEQSFLGKASTISQTGHTKAIPVSFLSTTVKGTTTMSMPSTTNSPRHTFEPELMEETKRQYDSILFKKDDLYVKRHDRFLNRDNELVLINNNLTYNLHQDGVKVFAPKTTLTPKELWKRLHLTISPITNEKVYVVTPQPPQAVEEKAITFRPRFSVRPTVAGLCSKCFIENRMKF
jgi:hypothetical protein